MEGLAGIAPDGRIAWMNRAASRLLGLSAGAALLSAEATLALTPAQLAALTRSHQPTSHRLPSGLQVWMLLRMQARDGLAAPVFQMAAPSAEKPIAAASKSTPSATETLRRSELHLIEAALASCEGNVSQAARSLGVSRGLIYRHLKQGKAAAAH